MSRGAQISLLRAEAFQVRLGDSSTMVPAITCGHEELRTPSCYPFDARRLWRIGARTRIAQLTWRRV
jgi:hypothetical protein